MVRHSASLPLSQRLGKVTWKGRSAQAHGNGNLLGTLLFQRLYACEPLTAFDVSSAIRRCGRELPRHETFLLPLIEEHISPAVRGDVHASHELLYLVSKYSAVGDDDGFLADRPEVVLSTSEWDNRSPFQGKALSSTIANVLRTLPTFGNSDGVVGSSNTIDVIVGSSEPLLHIRLLGLCALRQRHLHDMVAAELQRASLPLSTDIIESLLHIAAPGICHLLFDHQVRTISFHTGELGASDLSSVHNISPLLVASKLLSEGDVGRYWRAILCNDHFFSANDTEGMHDVLMRILQAIPSSDQLGTAAVWVTPQSFVGERDWWPLLNKTSRVYGRMKRGDLLVAFHNSLVKAFVGVERRMPLSYIVRSMGGILDSATFAREESTSQSACAHERAWDHSLAFLKLGLRLYGANEEHRNELFQLARKTALQLDPEAHDHVRLLDLFEAMSLLGYPVDLDKDAYAQFIQRVTAGIVSLSHTVHPSGQHPMLELVRRLGIFYSDHSPSLRFTWILDSCVTVLSTLFNLRLVSLAERPTSTTSPAESREKLLLFTTAAVTLVDTIQGDALPKKEVHGVDVRRNPRIRKLLEEFEVIERSLFWWTCGCGATNPCDSRNCLVCLRRGRVAWTCSSCGTDQVGKYATTECCQCRQFHPRVLAGDRLGVSFCVKCQAIVSADGSCPNCSPNEQLPDPHISEQLSGVAVNKCKNCATVLPAGKGCPPACPRCFAKNPVSEVKLWLCSTCFNFSYTTWSSCQRCANGSSVKRHDSLTVPYAAWLCGCGKANHSCKLACAACSTVKGADGVNANGYKCVGCSQPSSCKTYRDVTFPSETASQSTTLRVTLCDHCACPHPRDMLVLQSSALRRLCSCCGLFFKASKLDGHGPQVCSRCLALQTCNPNIPFRCSGTTRCSLRLRQVPQFGRFDCEECSTPRVDLDIDSVFVWRCVHPHAGENSTGCCDAWNTSWEATCRACGSCRPQVPNEIRARHCCWTCDSCCAHHPATTVLLCPNCDDGIQPTPLCAKCGNRHVSWHCPSIEQLIEAERLMLAFEAERDG